MAKIIQLLDIQPRHAKPKEKSYKLADGGSLYLEVAPTGGKLWRMKAKRASC
ncbi:MAG: Arm DNA-binding domain-containing protein [Alistipes senegalensis]|nr:Arm DNA-binding domain-containing protein [Oxalobacter formigenes]MCM1280467.1 Arm DNA-binding domain-containing protein [Alistipes senegalensis]